MSIERNGNNSDTFRPSHEPEHRDPARRGESCPDCANLEICAPSPRFMVPMHAEKRKGASLTRRWFISQVGRFATGALAAGSRASMTLALGAGNKRLKIAAIEEGLTLHDLVVRTLEEKVGGRGGGGASAKRKGNYERNRNR